MRCSPNNWYQSLKVQDGGGGLAGSMQGGGRGRKKEAAGDAMSLEAGRGVMPLGGDGGVILPRQGDGAMPSRGSSRAMPLGATGGSVMLQQQGDVRRSRICVLAAQLICEKRMGAGSARDAWRDAGDSREMRLMTKWYEEETSIARGGEEQLDVKMDVELDKELDMKKSHGRAREEREACARGEDEVQAGPAPGQTGRHAGAPGPWPGPTGRQAGSTPAPTGRHADANRRGYCATISEPGWNPVPGPENKSYADLITWREYEALRNEMRREFRARDDVLKGTVQEISQKLDTTCETVTTMKDQMTDIQRNLVDLRLAVENLTAQQQQEDEEDPELKDDAHNARGAPRGNRPRGWAPLGRNGRGHDEEDGLGVKTVDEYYMEMEMLVQRGRVRESLEMTMQRFLNGLKYDIKGIVRHYSYTNMNQLLHHAREAESQLADEAKVKGRATGAGRFTPRVAPSTEPAPLTCCAPYSTPPSKSVSNVPNTKKSESAASHFKRDSPNRKVMIINEDNEYETGDDVDPNAPEDDETMTLMESHAGGLMGHFGREKTLLMLADHFYWPKMWRDVDRIAQPFSASSSTALGRIPTPKEFQEELEGQARMAAKAQEAETKKASKARIREGERG
ncbi:hypothetical protein QYE76_067661 [Lolium multiflorum]|uniref:Integrase zinc-binding domain-containing protein n=1 Tax=Lolium multiflorum TaxID=4521 RepID=A0AAD8SEA5_LOLMU|nr:hypothetical protein QYE76_067661 [Lolium multiflorum]